MKTLQKRVAVLYRFRCSRCRSQYEMTEEEKFENDWKFTDEKTKENEINCHEKYGWKINAHNLKDHFDCPVCGCVREVMLKDMHRYSVMNDGTEIMDY